MGLRESGSDEWVKSEAAEAVRIKTVVTVVTVEPCHYRSTFYWLNSRSVKLTTISMETKRKM